MATDSKESDRGSEAQCDQPQAGGKPGHVSGLLNIRERTVTGNPPPAVLVVLTNSSIYTSVIVTPIFPIQ
jgi:hypothetical protein